MLERGPIGWKITDSVIRARIRSTSLSCHTHPLVNDISQSIDKTVVSSDWRFELVQAVRQDIFKYNVVYRFSILPLSPNGLREDHSARDSIVI